MKLLASLRFGLWALTHRSEINDDMEEELRSHIQNRADDLERSGMARAEAERRARIEFGGFQRFREECHDTAGGTWLESMVRDLRFSLRTLRKRPAATLIVILSIALGIGANATIFAMVSRFVLRPAPVGDPATLAAVNPDSGVGSFSWPLYSDLREQAKSFSGLAGYFPLLPASMGGKGEPEHVWGQAVTANFFDVAELRMLRGRGFTKNEEREPVAVLSAGLWRRRFEGDPAIVGKSVTISGQAYTVVGIAPASFHGIDQLIYAEFWVPLGGAERLIPGINDRNVSAVWIVGRLRSGVTRAQAAAEMNLLAQHLAARYPEVSSHHTFVLSEAGILPPSTQRPILIFLTALLTVALLVLAIAAFNAANLLLAQAVGRQREMAVRLALGAGRGRLRRQMLIDSVLLGLGGGAAGVVLSLWATWGLSSFRLPMPLPIDLSIGLDWRVLVGSFALSVLSGLLLGAGPAWLAGRPMLINALRGEDALARPGRRWTFRNLLTVAQIAMATILLSMTGLFLRSLESAGRIDIGFQPHHLLAMSVDPSLHGYTPEQTFRFLIQVRDRVAALPGVVSAAWTDNPPLSMVGVTDTFHVAGQQSTGNDGVWAQLDVVTPGYFKTIGIAQIAGRDFEEGSTATNVAIADREFVQRVFGGTNPIGRQVTNGKETWVIAGVVGDVRDTLGEGPRPALYRTFEQNASSDPLMGCTLLVRTAGNPNAFRDAARHQIHMLAPALAIYNQETMDEHVRNAFFLPRLAATLFGIVGGMGLVLATIGLYGVVSYGVSRRTREIGIRIAMGAERGGVERLVLRQGLVLSLIAVVLGWPAAWMLAKLSASFLYGIQPHDVLTFTIVPPLLILIALAACWVPARRAASVDPVTALRSE